MSQLKMSFEKNVAIITLCHPPANALSTTVIEELDNTLSVIEAQDDAHVILIHGEGRFFAAGADIKEFTSIKDEKEFTQLSRKGQILFDRMENFSKPIIAAIHGAALGGGLELAMACHIRLATENAKLGMPELQLGLIPGFAGTQRLPRYVGTAKAAEMMLTSEPITGIEAKELGLVNSVHTEQTLMEDALQLAQKIASKSTVSVRMTLELLRLTIAADQSARIIRESELFGQIFTSEDAKEGIQAFIEKRPPLFKNR